MSTAPGVAGISRRTLLTAAGAVGALGASAALAGPASARTAGAGRPVIGRARGELLHAMSFNIRYDRVGQTQPGEPDYWPERAPLTTEFLRLEQPTVLGVQEVLFHQLAAVEEGLGRHYKMVGFGRDGGAGGEYSGIFYDARRLTVKWWDQFWLSDTPQVIGSATWGNTVTRIVTWAELHDSVTGRDFLHINSHFDHQAENARVRSARVVRDQVAAAGLPVVFTADCNATAGSSAPYDILVTDGGLRDTWLDADRQLTPYAGTFPNYGTPNPDGTRIDWILTTPGVEVRAAAINTWTRDGRYPSDHTPVQALLKI
ncbi:endonuclease/exonuclease/phosphatase family protein [Promicromonospora iranensis]|uniref:Endonuclease/exonuclease/phosphatase family metal-dependent hydrolase n=1 Tax=Promicromonospora iranensis TaxID=1105144 RepID=A0ABU2CQL8_9MICO|nr:endonuclease/exonuclease/phosphatase family protein [Promicromonospora iranensis]MDR7383636.1 endonuclease/exonuclease/phosphatase family metal-dependent hydrolase [Promicromonospora iranensis]